MCVFICSSRKRWSNIDTLPPFDPLPALHLGFLSPGTRVVPGRRSPNSTQTADKQSATAQDWSLGLNLGKCWRRQVRAEVGQDRFWWPMGLTANRLMSGSALAGLWKIFQLIFLSNIPLMFLGLKPLLRNVRLLHLFHSLLLKMTEQTFILKALFGERQWRFSLLSTGDSVFHIIFKICVGFWSFLLFPPKWSPCWSKWEASSTFKFSFCP